MKTEPSICSSFEWKTSDEEHSGAVEESPLFRSEGIQLYSLPLWKRITDLAILVLALPFLVFVMLVISIWIRRVSQGPVLFSQSRVGFGGELFTIYKFRTMLLSSETDTHTEHVQELMRSNKRMTKLDQLGDDRLIRGGVCLRALGLDELPQVFNVLRGDLSFVGPRPCVGDEYALYSDAEKKRFGVHPGLTGYWQVMGKNKTTFTEMIEMDEHYVNERSLKLDLWILWRTPCVLLGQLLESLKKPKAE